MMKNLLLLCILLFFLSCKGKSEFANRYLGGKYLDETPSFDYQQVKQNVKALKIYSEKERTTLLYSYAKDTIFPAWMGTPWDFNGTTEIPRTGQIACGYFVTTVIRDLGFKIDRIKMAQQVSSAIIKKYCTDVKHYAEMDKMIADCSKKTNSLFIVGLDFHTGFLLNENGTLYFVHASYGNPRCVVKEKADESAVLASSKTFMTGDFLNESIIHQYWGK